MPAELRARDRWVRHDRAKRPLTVTGAPASSTNPSTWTTYAKAKASTAGVGLGTVLDGDGVVVLDLDGCIVGGKLTSAAARLVALAGSTYVEISPSGHGLHIFGRSDVFTGGRRLPGVEVYATGRYVTVTGRRWSGSPPVLGDVSRAIDAVLSGRG
ncbi:bifunctional DNA primase/polymerase [Polymorphospora rubra]|uniref:bifunctional DNA primase/polymerase n=1 Tax=Polymorphospora rubra TaxID=338584 RepID=UPI0033EBB632